jgi:hypothetical protein
MISDDFDEFLLTITAYAALSSPASRAYRRRESLARRAVRRFAITISPICFLPEATSAAITVTISAAPPLYPAEVRERYTLRLRR